MPTEIVQHLGDGSQAVRRARGVRNDEMVLRQLVVVDAVDDGQVGAVGRCRDEHPLGAGIEMQLRLFLRREDAGALECNINAESLMRQLGGILDRRHLDRAAADVDRVARNFHFVREAAVHAVVTEKMRVRLDGAEIVDGDDFDVVATALDDRAQHIATDAAETVDRHLHCHSWEILRDSNLS